MKLALAASLNTDSQQEYQLKRQSNGQIGLYLGTKLQDALKLENDSNLWVGVSGRTVSLSASESEATQSRLKLHRPSPTSRQLRAYLKKDSPSLPDVRRIVDSIEVNGGIAQFNF